MNKTTNRRIIAVLMLLLCLVSLSACYGETGNTVSGDGMTVHFIDVGQADSALLLCGGESLLIDGGNAGDSSLIYSYLKEQGVRRLDYIIATHPHEDHVGGIPGALSLVSEVGTAYSPVDEDESYRFVKMTERLEEMGVYVTVPRAGDSFGLGEARVTFLGPLEMKDDVNQNSLVCKVEYGDVSFLFTGDAERPAEELMLDAGEDLSATVLKVGHHGSGSSSCQRFLREVSPAYAVISCGKNNSYGHPDDGLLSRLKDAGAVAYRTDQNGHIVFTTDGTTLSVSCEKGASPQEAFEEAGGGETASQDGPMYIGNVSSKKYHLPTCTGLPAEKNRVYFYSFEEAEGSGFSPCGLCKP